jgi:glycosyltransferase involved in cell wall biosynthesis
MLNLPPNDVPTFKGDKFTLRGKLAATKGLTRLPVIAHRFLRMLAENRTDVALCGFQSIWDVATLPILARGSVRSVLVLHDAFFHPGDEYPFRHNVLRRQIQNADALIVLSEHVRNQAIKGFAYPAGRIWKISHGAFKFGTQTVRPAAHPCGSRPLRLLFFGRIVAYKGLGHLLRSQKILQQRGMQVELVIAGSGSLNPYAGLLEDVPGVEIHNRWLTDDEIANLMACCDIAVLPYVEASQSGVVVSAFAAGRPVVATPVGGLTEQVFHGKTGLLAHDMSVEALADAIAEFINNPRLFDRCAVGALDHAQDQLSWRKSAEVIAEVIDVVRAAPRRNKAETNETAF